MLNATRDLVLPTTITGSYPRPGWFTEGLHRRPFKDALGDSVFREQYLHAVSCVIGEQVRARLDIVTDGDSRFDRTVGGRSWFKKIAIGVVSHTSTAVEPPEVVADLIRKALEYVPPERLILSTDCGFGREGLARRIASYKCVAITLGANLVRGELGLPQAPVPAADPRFA
jgi:methionine synthase II (cobalamin-independent)